MAEIKEAIETMIQESYLLGLSEPEIVEDLQRFVRRCVDVIGQNVKDKRAAEQLKAKLKFIGTRALVPNTTGENVFKTDGTMKTSRELLAEQAARHKRLMLKMIGEYDPKLVRAIERERYHRIPKSQIRSGRRMRARTKLLILRVCYLILVVFLLILIYIAILERG